MTRSPENTSRAGHAHRPAANPRRSQAERRTETRQKLLDATIACLSQQGYGATSTTAVVARAGLSRGAQVHHFPTKLDLVVAAADHAIESQAADFRRAISAVPAGADPLHAVLDTLWEILVGPAGRAFSALREGSRADEDLRTALRETRTTLMRVVETEFRNAFPELDLPPTWWQAVPLMVFSTIEGLAEHHQLDPLDPTIAEARRVLHLLLSTAPPFSAETS